MGWINPYAWSNQVRKIQELESKVELLESKVLKLKCENYVYKDSQLRTYDGLAQRADILAQAVKFLTTMVAECDDLNVQHVDIKDIKELLSEIQSFK